MPRTRRARRSDAFDPKETLDAQCNRIGAAIGAMVLWQFKRHVRKDIAGGRRRLDAI
jgi:hypothetical protein